MMSEEPLSIVFMGTPEFAVPSLLALLEGPDRVTLVVTQPDRPRGRGMEAAKSPVRLTAEAHAIPVVTPEKASDPGFIQHVRDRSPNLIVVVAYGQILRRSLLDIPPMGVVNVHASLLPAYRGAAPINRAIIDGQVVTGVTTMMLDEGVDTGDVLLSREVPIGSEETAGQLAERLAGDGAHLLIETIEALKEGRIQPVAQDHAKATHAPMLKKEDGLIDWSKTPEAVKNHIRGMTPWPGAFTRLGDRAIKVFGIRQDSEKSGAPPGTIVRVAGDGIYVAAGGRVAVITDLQAPGKQRMEAGQFVRGNKIPVGARFDVP
jgi:methionyl-tRNA formyltransferase